MKIIEMSGERFHEVRYRTSGRRGVVRKVTLPFYKVTVDFLPGNLSSFVVVSDIQGRECNKKSNRLVGEAVADELAFLQKHKTIPKIDFVALAGDLYDYPDCKKLGGTGDVTSVWNAFSRICSYVVGVHGNHDTVLNDELNTNTVVLDGSTVDIQGIRIGGVCGVIGDIKRNQRKSEAQFKQALTQIDSSDIILLHHGPDDPDNNQKGEPMIREHFEAINSGIVIFGHSHWKKPFITNGNNQFLNADNRLYVFMQEPN